jgi:hypothetical protein
MPDGSVGAFFIHFSRVPVFERAWAWGVFSTMADGSVGSFFYLFLTNSMFLNRRQRGVFCHQWQTEAWELAGVLFFTSFDGLISRERGGFVWNWKWLEPFGNGRQFWELVNLVWTWLFLEFLINSVLIPSSMWIKNLKNALGNQQSMTEIIRVAERCARKKQTNLDSNSTQTSLKNVEKVGCAWNFYFFESYVSKLV